MIIVSDIRNPCNCGSAIVPRQYQDEVGGFDVIECGTCGDTETVIDHDACITQWNAANLLHTWAEVIANGGPFDPPIAWTPDDMTSLLAWYDSSDASTITESGGDVSQLDDKSGSGHHYVQATGSSQPKTGTTTINSLNTIYFNGTGDWMMASGLSIPLFAGDELLWSFIFDPDDVSGDYRYNLIGGVPGLDGMNRGIAPTSAEPWKMLATKTAVPQLMTLHLTGTTSEVWVDGVSIDSNAYSAEVADTITSFLLSHPTNNMLGKIGEHLYYSDASERADVETYLLDKWGI